MKYIIPTSAAAHLGRRMEEEIASLKINSAAVLWPGKNKDGERYFPDEEVYARILEAEKGLLNGTEVVHLHSGQRKPNAGIIELETGIECVQEYATPKRQSIFFSQYPYRRQDKKFESGEVAKAAKLYDRFKGWYHIDDIFILEAHFAGSEKWDFNKRPFIAVNGNELLMNRIRNCYERKVLFLGPDIGARARSGLAATVKIRTGAYDVEIAHEDGLKQLIKEHATIAVIDDETSTGGTLIRFRDYCREINPDCKMVAGLVHGVKQKGIDRVMEAYDGFFLTNTVFRKEANVDVTELIMRKLGILG